MGIDTEVSRGELAVRLLRPVAVLCALHLYRFGFAVGTVVVSRTALIPVNFRHESCCHEPYAINCPALQALNVVV